jgi:hypothetical protein
MSVANRKSVRDAIDAWEREGCRVESCIQTRGDHYRLRVRLPDGRELYALAAASASCPRAPINNRARIRRALRGLYERGVTLIAGKEST